MSDRAEWMLRYTKQLDYMSAALIGAGVVYLLAANWFVFPSYVQLAIPQGLLILFSILTAYFNASSIKGHCTAALAALMVGMSLATYGQVYQTGADSFQLFGAWALLLLPWLSLRLTAVWAIFDIILFLTLHLANKQWLALSSDVYLICFSLLALFQLGLTHRFCRSSRLCLLLLIAALSCFFSISYLFKVNSYHSGSAVFHSLMKPGWITVSFILPAVIAVYYHRFRWAAGMSIAVLTIGINSSFFIIERLIERIDATALVMFVIAAIIFLWCWWLTKLLRIFLPDNFSWTGLPSAFGAWIASIILTGGFYLLFDNDVSIILILGLLGAGFALLHFKSTHIFSRHLSFAVTLCGQLMLFSYIMNEFIDSNSIHITLIFAQVSILIGSWLISANQYWRSLQCFLLILVFQYGYHDYSVYLLFIPFAIWALMPAIMNQANQRIPLIFSLLTAVFFAMCLQFSRYFINGEWTLLYFHPSQMIAAGFLIVTLVILARANNWKVLLAFLLLSSLLIVLNLLPILAVLTVLVVIDQYRDNVMNALALIVLALCLWLFYYALALPLIVKGAVIIVSGMLLGAISIFSGNPSRRIA
jgi:hypothetical protein